MRVTRITNDEAAGAASYRPQAWHPAMVADLLAVSRGLVYDPVGAAGTGTTPLHRELRALEAVLRTAHRADAPRPARVRVDARSISSIARRGIANAAAIRPAVTHDPASLRATRAIQQRIREIADTAETAIRSIERSRRYRDTPMPGHSTLYADVDVPRLRALQDVLRTARRLAARAIDVPASAQLVLASRSAALSRRAQRPLSALYERWVFLEIVKAFNGGLDADLTQRLLGEGDGPARDFDERTQYAQSRPDGRTLRIRFEPWILTRELAIAGEHGIYRGPTLAHAWRPDIVIQVERGTRYGIPVVTSAYIIDAKLASAPRRELWDQVLKYSAMHASIDDAPVVRLIALALPASDDGGIGFYESLPAAPPVPLRVLPLLPGNRTPAGVNALARLVAEVR